jgi:cytochrome c
MRWKHVRWGLGAVFVAALSGAFSYAHPFGDPRKVNVPAGNLLAGAEIPQRLRDLIQHKCGNCHSENVDWPIYSRMAPVSWLLERDVAEARMHVNLSRWTTYSDRDKLDLLNRFAAKVHSGEMPPGRYTLLHPDSKLLREEQEGLYNWAKSERRRLKTEGK